MNSVPLLASDPPASSHEANKVVPFPAQHAVRRPHVLPYSVRSPVRLRPNATPWTGTMLVTAVLAIVVVSAVAAAIAR